MKKIILIIIILALSIGGGIFLTSYFDLFNRTDALNKTTSINISSTVKEVLPSAEFTSIIYHYTDVITHSDAIRFFDFGNIPFTERRAIYTIDGIIKLGINCENMEIEISDNAVTLNMPPVVILSHEIFPETFHLYDERSGLFNRYSLEDSYMIHAMQRQEREKKINENPVLFAQARTSVEQQFGRLLENLPGIKDVYKIEFNWK